MPQADHGIGGWQGRGPKGGPSSDGTSTPTTVGDADSKLPTYEQATTDPEIRGHCWRVVYGGCETPDGGHERAADQEHPHARGRQHRDPQHGRLDATRADRAARRLPPADTWRGMFVSLFYIACMLTLP